MMDFKHIAIIGVGLIGGSLALSLKNKGYKGTITGIGRTEENLIRAQALGMLDNYSTSHVEGVKGADLIVLASSVGHFKKIVTDIRENINKRTIVTDVGSVKTGIIKELEPLMPEGVRFVGGHPIAGKECSGIDGATAELFHSAKCILTPSVNTDRDALDKVIDLWKRIGAETVVMSPEEHDLIFASVSHMPHVVAYGLVNSLLDIDKNVLMHGGTGLKDMTRIALSSPELWRDICSYNREDILKALRTFSSSLSRMIELFEQSDWPGLEEKFKRAKEARQLIESD
jgi:prephenate dehydrogenase